LVNCSLVTSDIFSQAADFHSAGADSYEADSFCVGDGDVEYESQVVDALDCFDETQDTMRVRTTTTTSVREKRSKGDGNGKRRRIQAPVSSSEDEPSILKTPEVAEKAASRVQAAPTESSPTEKAREERLQKQKEKQEEFKKKMKEKRENDKSSKNGETEKSYESILAQGERNTQETTYFVKPNLNASLELAKKPTLVVSSSIVHKMPGLISLFKHRVGFAVVVERFEGASFLASPRMGIDRWLISEFCNGANKKKVVERCQKMNDLFERPVVVVETDKNKDDEGHAAAHPARDDEACFEIYFQVS
jgi:hypothetical protein